MLPAGILGFMLLGEPGGGVYADPPIQRYAAQPKAADSWKDATKISPPMDLGLSGLHGLLYNFHKGKPGRGS